jgi:hypothetical protein
LKLVKAVSRLRFDRNKHSRNGWPYPFLSVAGAEVGGDDSRIPVSACHLVVDRVEYAGVELGFAVRAQCDGLDRTLCERLLHLRDVGCPNVLNLVDHDQSVSLGRRPSCRARVNDVADIKQTNSGDPVEDIAAEIDPPIFEIGRVASEIGLRLI